VTTQIGQLDDWSLNKTDEWWLQQKLNMDYSTNWNMDYNTNWTWTTTQKLSLGLTGAQTEHGLHDRLSTKTAIQCSPKFRFDIFIWGRTQNPDEGCHNLISAPREIGKKGTWHQQIQIDVLLCAARMTLFSWLVHNSDCVLAPANASLALHDRLSTKRT
jgi:hypothetical protein